MQENLESQNSLLKVPIIAPCDVCIELQDNTEYQCTIVNISILTHHR